jgi:aspartyl/asparaginyl beta-hydroxylase (cupin superfamily)
MSPADQESKLAARGLRPVRWSPRLRQALDVAAGRLKPVPQLQQPTVFNYPGLPQVRFYDAAQFPLAAEIEAATPAILEELKALTAGGTDEFQAYVHVKTEEIDLGPNEALLQNRDWSVLFLSENNWIVPKVVERCPRTWETVLKAPLPRVSGWGPTVVFSLLKAGARIAPHHGTHNTRLICHLPLVVPPGCGFRVGDEVREWEVGKLMIFDDTIEHEAWNDSQEDRIVLIFDIWRPELSEQEKYELTLLFSD